MQGKKQRHYTQISGKACLWKKMNSYMEKWGAEADPLFCQLMNLGVQSTGLSMSCHTGQPVYPSVFDIHRHGERCRSLC